MKTTTRQITVAASADAAVMPPPPRTKVPPHPSVPAVPPAATFWQSSLSGASESTLRHLIYSPESDNFNGEGSEPPR